MLAFRLGQHNNSLNQTRPSLLTCGTLNYALSAMPVARIRARRLAQKGYPFYDHAI